MNESETYDGARDDSDSDQEPLPALEEGLDYYLENGLMVFTGAFLLKRGYCCERGCRHCPYGYVKKRIYE